MMKRFRFVSLALIIVFFVLALAGCSDEINPESDAKLTVFVPDGAPALTFAMLMDGVSEPVGYDFTYNVVTGESVAAKVLNGEADIAVIPTNAAAKLISKGAPYTMTATVLQGLLYLVTKGGSATEMTDLVGQVVLSIGQGNTPEYVFKYILDHANIPYVNSDVPVAGSVAIRYMADASEILPMLVTGQAQYAILGEPAVSQAAAKGITSLFDIQALWDSAVGAVGGYPQACLVVKNSVIEAYPQLVASLMDSLSATPDWLSANAARLTDIITAHGSTLTVQMTAGIVERCNIDIQGATDARAAIEAYLSVLLQFAPQSIGGTLPADTFYYQSK